VIRGHVGPERLPWRAIIRRYHDEVIEDLLAQADRAASGRRVEDRRCSGWASPTASSSGSPVSKSLKPARGSARMNTPKSTHRVVVVGGGFRRDPDGARPASVRASLPDHVDGMRTRRVICPLLSQYVTFAAR
jgi:hypothetical protein